MLFDLQPTDATTMNLDEFHSVNIHSHTFVVPRCYQLYSVKGVGSFGLVCAAKNLLTGKDVAIKKVINPFESVRDAKRILREIRLLRHFSHDNILGINDICKPYEGRQNFKDVYIVTELMDTDLHQIIQSQQQLSQEHIQYFVYQILRGLKHIHSANVIHRDLKPGNLLVNSDCLVKICDFGMARQFESEEEETEYVATRWYRAPEVILSWKHYTKGIDLWAVGCIFAELLGRAPLFPGQDYLHQIARIVEVIGAPSEDDLRWIANDQAKNYVRSLGPKVRVPFATLYPNAPAAAHSLLEGLLEFNPAKRLTAAEALSHPYFQGLHDPNDEPEGQPVQFDFEDEQLQPAMYRELIYREMAHYHPELLANQTMHALSNIVNPVNMMSPINGNQMML